MLLTSPQLNIMSSIMSSENNTLTDYFLQVIHNKKHKRVYTFMVDKTKEKRTENGKRFNSRKS